jgi:hypothetical protein
MFVGHYAPALIAAAHPRAPRLGTLFVAAQLVDIAFFAFLPLGIEHMRVMPGASVMNPMDLYDMPWTHSLVGAACWAIGFALLVRVATGDTIAGVVAGIVVLSHWFLDLLVHVPDLTLAGSPPRLGFGLWNHPAIEMPLELALLAGGLWLYARATRAAGRLWALWILLVVLLALQAINWFGVPPTRVDASVWGLGLFAYMLAAAVAWWVARNRVRR